jgi:hypothetical protein
MVLFGTVRFQQLTHTSHRALLNKEVDANDGLITISGVMLDGQDAKEVFRNGISFNNLMICN